MSQHVDTTHESPEVLVCFCLQAFIFFSPLAQMGNKNLLSLLFYLIRFVNNKRNIQVNFLFVYVFIKIFLSGVPLKVLTIVSR